MRRTVTLAAVLIIALAGCSTHPALPITSADLGLARQFDLFTFYWVGTDFHGIQLTAADSKREYDASVGVRAYYGNCRKSPLVSTSGCRLPLEIATVLYKPHSNEGLGARQETLIRGVPAEIYNDGSSIELYTGRLAIDIYAESPGLARAAAEALVPLNRAAPATRALEPPRLPPGVDPRVEATADRLPVPPLQVAPRPRRG
ncbi:MAG: hypothetical protein ACR2KV_06230 [Solirubrobacteraceae bacterium]